MLGISEVIFLKVEEPSYLICIKDGLLRQSEILLKLLKQCGNQDGDQMSVNFK